MAPRRIVSAIRANHTRRHSLHLQYTQELFAPCLEFQYRSSNLVFYDRSQGGVVEFPYPMSGGRRIIPTGILGYNERRRQAWECFCGLLSPELPAFVKIDNTTNGTIGSCDDCGLYDTDELFTSVSFDDKHDTATTTADYPAFDRYGANTLRDNSAIQPAALPDRVAPVARRRRAVHRRAPYASTGPRRRSRVQIRSTVQQDSDENESHASSSNLPSPRQLLAGIRSPHPETPIKRERSPTRFLSLSSPTSSTAAALISGPYRPTASGSSRTHGSSATRDEVLQFCDSCFAAYPVESFATHECDSD
ncbi:hypothetical protein K439DRAFT_1611741 [Ramaria rubella]|nr:hypothetical protein K439DRAFT_1611741 [Ramaria rubella]